MNLSCYRFQSRMFFLKISNIFFLEFCSYNLIEYSRLPINWKTPLRYTIVLILESMIAFYSGLFFSALMSYFIGSCWLLKSLVKDITHDFVDWNIEINASNIEPNFEQSKNSYAKQTNIRHHFCNILQLHADAKQLSVSKLQNQKYLLNLIQ